MAADLNTILLIEDDLTTAYLLNQAAKAQHLEVTFDAHGTGEAGLRRLLELHAAGDPPLLVLADLRLPGMDGAEVVRAIRRDPRLAGLPAIIYTGSLLAEDRRRAIGAGVDRFFVKPEDFDALCAFIEDVTGPWVNR